MLLTINYNTEQGNANMSKGTKSLDCLTLFRPKKLTWAPNHKNGLKLFAKTLVLRDCLSA